MPVPAKLTRTRAPTTKKCLRKYIEYSSVRFCKPLPAPKPTSGGLGTTTGAVVGDADVVAAVVAVDDVVAVAESNAQGSKCHTGVSPFGS